MNDLYEEEDWNDLYDGDDVKNVPIYSIGEAARYLRIPHSTVRSWVKGYLYRVKRGSNFFVPLINVAAGKPCLLSFTNLVEIHLLRAITKHHKIQLSKVREALDFINDPENPVAHPLATEKFATDGVDLFVEKYGSLIKASKQGELDLRKDLEAHLQRIELSDQGLAIKLFPFTRPRDENSPRLIVIDPRVAFGRLVIAGTGIPTSILKERYCAGDSIQSLANDYNCDISSIEEAIRCEIPMAA